MSQKYRIKEEKLYGESFFTPQKRLFWWWFDMTQIVNDSWTGYIEHRSFRFNTYKECEHFIALENHNKDIIYHYGNF